jgi:hypothetical protein
MWLRKYGLKPAVQGRDDLSEQDRMPLGVAQWIDMIDTVIGAVERGA